MISTRTEMASVEALRIGCGSAVILAWTGDKNLARSSALKWAAECPALAGTTARVTRVTIRAGRYYTFGYEGPATTVSLGLVHV